MQITKGLAMGSATLNSHMTQFQIEGGGVVQGVTKLISTFSAFVT